MTECEACRRSIFKHNIALYRTNEKGVKGIFKCEDCLADEYIDPDVYRIINVILEDNEKRKENENT